METSSKIFVDRLQQGKVEKVKENFDPAILQVEEKDLQFPEKVAVLGGAYLAEDHLILCFKISTRALMPCTICNERILVPLKVEKFYHTVPIAELSSPIFDYLEPLREALLLEVPKYVECNDGNCSERKNIEKYLKIRPNHETHFPFSGLEN